MRKRGIDGADDFKDHRRIRLEGSGEYQTKILLKHTEFAKVIGRGGRMVNDLRQKTGAHIKGIDLEGDDRLIMISGRFNQMQEAFEEIVDVLFVSYSDFKERRLLEGSSIHDISPFAVFLLLKNDQAGRLIGSRGATISDIQARTNCTMQISREPASILPGEDLRGLVCEGGPRQIHAGHHAILSLYMQSGSDRDPGGRNGRDRDRDRDRDRSSSDHQASGNGSPPAEAFTITSPALLHLGVPVDLVMSVLQAQAALVPYNIDLQGVLMTPPAASNQSHALSDTQKSSASSPSRHPPSGDTQHQHSEPYDPMGSSIDLQNAQLPDDNYHLDSRVSSSACHHNVDSDTGEHRLEFFISSENAGAVIGHRGQNLRSTEDQFNLRVQIDRDHLPGKLRRVTLRAAKSEAQVMDCMKFIRDLAARPQNSEP